MSYEVMVLNPRPRKRKGRKHRARRKRTTRRSAMAMPRRGRHGRFVKSRRKHNPRKKRRAAKVAAAPKRRRRRSSAGKRRPAMGYVVGTKRIRRKKLNPRRRHARRYNPRFTVAGITSALVPAAWGAGGAIALDVALGYASPMLPAMLTTGYAKHATRIAGALGIGWVGRKFFGSRGHAIGAGALTVAVYKLLKDVVVQFAPNVPGLGDYEQITIPDTGNINGYIPGTVAGAKYLPDGSVSEGAGAYMEGMGAYMEGQYVEGIDF